MCPLGRNIKISTTGGGGQNAPITTKGQEFVAIAGQTIFTVTLFTLITANAKVYVNASWQTSADFTALGQVVTLTVPLLGGEIVSITN